MKGTSNMSQRTLPPIFAAAALVLALSGCGRNDPDKLVTAAEGYLAKNEVPAAVIELKNALTAAPENARARFLLGRAYLDSGDLAGAAAELRKAIALKYPPDEAYPLLAKALAGQRAPQSEIAALADAPVTTPRAKAEIASAMAAAYLQANDLVRAQATVDRALALDPTQVGAQVTHARLLAVRNDLPPALAEANAVLEKSPNNLDALLLKAEVESIMGRPADARATVENMVKVSPNYMTARYMLVTLLVREKQIDQAAAEAETMRKIAPNDPRTAYSTGIVAFARGDYPAALVAVQNALKAAPNFAPAMSLSALVDIQRGSYGAAEQSLRAVLAQVPNDVPARVALAQVMLRTGDVDKARAALAPLVDLPQVDALTLRMAAEVETAANRRDLATQFAERANAIEANSTGGRVRLAQLKLAKGDVQAVQELQAIAATEPQKTEADVALVEGYLRSRDYPKALAAADALIKKQPQQPGGYNVKGTVYAARGDMKNAREMYEKAVALDPKFISALLNLASTDAVEHKFADARKRYDQILAVDPKFERALLGIAQLGITTNDTPANVAAAIQRAIDANPRSPTARLALVSYYLRVKDFRAAVTAAQAASTAIPDNPAILEALGAAQQAAGDRSGAVETFSRWAKLQPGNPVPQIRLGTVQLTQKNYDAAAGAFSAVIAMNPNNPQAWLGLATSYIEADKISVGLLEAMRLQKDTRTRLAGYVLEGELQAQQKKLPEAIAAYRAALQREPVPQAAIRLHMLLTASAKPDEAAAFLQKYLKDHPKEVLVRNYVGQQAIARGDYKEAAVQYRAAVATEPDNLTILNNLAWSLSEIKDPQALEFAAHAYSLAPGNPSVANTYGWVLVQKGDLTQGIAALRRAVALSPEDADYRIYLARALIQSGDKPGARKELEVAAKSENPKARGQAEQLIKTL